MKTKNEDKVIGFPNPSGSPTVNRKLVVRWGGHDDLFAEGWVGIPVAFLRHYGTLKPYGLTNGQAMFIVQLMAYKWTEEAPFPSYRSLATRMDVSVKMVRRYAAELEAKGYLKREARIGSTNSFDLTSLFDALRDAVIEERKVA